MALLSAAAGSTAVLLPLSTASAEQPQAEQQPRMHLALAAYSFRKYFEYVKGKPQKRAGIDPNLYMTWPRFIQFCADQGLPRGELTTYFVPPQEVEKAAADLRMAAFRQGISWCGTAIGNNFDTADGDRLEREIEDALRWIQWTAAVGAPHVRFFAGTAAGLRREGAMQQVVEATRRCAERAAELGVSIGIENHGGLTAEQTLQIVDAIDHPAVGINLDSGNFPSDDPYADFAACAPRAIHTQIKVEMKHPDGQRYPADLERVIGILKDAGYRGSVVLEYEEDENPYEAIPPLLDRLRQLVG